MVKAKRLLQENLKLVEAVIELIDARVPLSSKNPDFDKMLENKKKIIVLNKSDLADPRETEKWLKYYKRLGIATIAVNSLTGAGISRVIKTLDGIKPKKRYNLRKLKTPIRVMVVGVPNVGKSAFINKIAGRASAKTGDKPGVTRGKQWIKVKENIEILDTPGVLWPRLEGEGIGFKLAAVNAIGQNAYDRVDLVLRLLNFLKEESPEGLNNRYKIDQKDLTAQQILERIGAKRGCLLHGNVVDFDATAAIILKEFRMGKIAKLTLDRLDEDV